MPATWVKTCELSLDTLTRFPGNARRGNVAEIRKSLMRHGQYRAVVVRQEDDTYTVLAGNHTTDALNGLVVEPPTLDQLLALVPPDIRKKQEPTAQALLDQLERRTARCEIITCTDDEARRIALADNRLSDIAVDDPEALSELLTSLDGDFDGTGWDQGDLDLLQGVFDDAGNDSGLDDVDDAAAKLERAGWPVIHVAVPAETRDRWDALMKEGHEAFVEDHERTAAIITLAERAKSAGLHLDT